MLKKYFLFFLVLITALNSLAMSGADSTLTVKTSIKYYLESDFKNGNASFQTLDTSLENVDKVNQAIDFRFNYLGVPGSAAQSLNFKDYSELTTRTSIRNFNIYYSSQDSINFFNVNKKFTDIKYHNGTFREQVISVLHTQNIVKGWNAGIKFQRFSVKDYMIFSDTYNGEFVFFTSYSSPNSRYHLFANGIWNSIENQVNGGLKNDSSFIYGNVDNVGIKSLAWKISDAKQIERNRDFYLSQYYDLGEIKKDSSGNIISKSTIRINHEISLNRNSFVYKDSSPDSSFYNNFYYSPSTYDSLYSDVLNNKLAIILPSDKLNRSSLLKSWSLSGSINYQLVKYGQLLNLSWHNIVVEGTILSNNGNANYFANLNAQYVSDGKDQGNYNIEGSFKTKEFEFGAFGLKADVSKKSSDYYLSFFTSNNFFWKNNFSKIQNKSVSIFYEWSKYKLRIEFEKQLVNNAIYINEFAFPTQSSQEVDYTKTTLTKNFQWRDYHSQNTFVFQNISDQLNFHLSPFYSSHSLFLRKGLFEKKLLTDFGVNVAYNQSYFSDDYLPASSLFYNQSNLKTQGYLRVDLFIRAKLKSAFIFLKMENVGDNIGNKSYFLVPHYPMPGRVFRFGVSWRFYDQ